MRVGGRKETCPSPVQHHSGLLPNPKGLFFSYFFTLLCFFYYFPAFTVLHICVCVYIISMFLLFFVAGVRKMGISFFGEELHRCLCLWVLFFGLSFVSHVIFFLFCFGFCMFYMYPFPVRSFLIKMLCFFCSPLPILSVFFCPFVKSDLSPIVHARMSSPPLLFMEGGCVMGNQFYL